MLLHGHAGAGAGAGGRTRSLFQAGCPGGGGCFSGAAGVRAMTSVANSPGVLQVLDVVSEGFTVHFSLIGQRIQADEVKALEHLNPSGARRPTQPG